MERIEQAIILAAGEGQRLRPFTGLTPKVMLPIANKPILQYVVEALAVNGIRHIVMVVGYRKEQVQDYFASGHDFDVEIDYVFQRQQLGTAHALRQAGDMVMSRFLVLSGDNIIEPATITPLINTRSNAVLIKTHENASKYGVVVVKDGLVSAILEKPKEKISNLVNTGIYAFSRDVIEFLEEEVDLPSAVQRMITCGHRIAAMETTGTWLDAVYPWDILELNDTVLCKLTPTLGGTIESGSLTKGLVSIGKGTTIRANCYILGPVIIGENCEIGPNVCIFPSTSVGNNVTVYPFSTITNSVIASNVSIGSGSVIQDSLIAPGCFVGGHFIARSGEALVTVDEEHHHVKLGTVMGWHCQLQDNIVVQPGIIIGNHSKIRALKVISENVPDESLVF